MILLDKNDYNKVFEPLDQVTINNIFAVAVARNIVNGAIYVDKTDAPSTFYILHPYSMSLLLGECGNEAFNQAFYDHAFNLPKKREAHEWMQAYPRTWDRKLSAMFGDKLIKSDSDQDKEGKIELNTRVNFKFNRSKYQEFKLHNQVNNFQIVRTDKQIFREMRGSVVPMYFWKDADHFYENGVGFSLFYENKLASTAYSAFLLEDKLEIGIETVAEFRGKGLAQHACSVLIQYCLNNELEPVWSCRFENFASYKLALKLGFEPTFKLPYYRLCK